MVKERNIAIDVLKFIAAILITPVGGINLVRT